MLKVEDEATMDPCRKRTKITPTSTNPRIRNLQNRVSAMLVRMLQARDKEVVDKNNEILSLKQQVASIEELVRRQSTAEFLQREQDLRNDLLKASEANLKLRQENVIMSKASSDHLKIINDAHEKNKTLKDALTRINLELESIKKQKREVEAKLMVMEMELDASFTFDEDVEGRLRAEWPVGVPMEMLLEYQQPQEIPAVKAEEDANENVTGVLAGLKIKLDLEAASSSSNVGKKLKNVRDSTSSKKNRKDSNTNHSPVPVAKEERKSPRQLHALDVSAHSFSCVCGSFFESIQVLHKHIDKYNSSGRDRESPVSH